MCKLYVGMCETKLSDIKLNLLKATLSRLYISHCMPNKENEGQNYIADHPVNQQKH